MYILLYNAFHMSCVGLCERKKAPSGDWACVIVARIHISNEDENNYDSVSDNNSN